MDELTLERYPMGMSYSETKARPTPVRGVRSVEDLVTILERRAILVEAMRPKEST